MLTGIGTPFGNELLRALLDDPEVTCVLAIGRPHDPAPDPHPRMTYRAVDLTRARAVRDLVHGEARELAIDRVFHGIQHRAASDRGRSVHLQNVTSTRELVRACSSHPTIRRFVYRSFAEVYELSHTSANLIDEEAPLDFAPASPQWVRDRVEADLDVCAHFGSSLQIAVLRFAEVFAPDVGSQLWDYMQSRVCLRPLGFDPMINVLSIGDAVAASMAALRATATGVFNIRGADTLPLSRAIIECGRIDLPVPGPLMAPLYGLRTTVTGFAFRYDMNLRRFHFGGVLDGARARRELGYSPRIIVAWPQTWWSRLAARLAADRG
jgi:UDP-glucose 4-epimerase